MKIEDSAVFVASKNEAGTRPASSSKHTVPSAPAHRMHAAASFPTVITACSISGDHGLL